MLNRRSPGLIAAIVLVVTSTAHGAPRDLKAKPELHATTAAKDKGDDDDAVTVQDDPDDEDTAKKHKKAKESDDDDDSAKADRKKAKEEEEENRAKERRHLKDKPRRADDNADGGKPKRAEKAKDSDDDEERKPKHRLRSKDKDDSDDDTDSPKKKRALRAKVKDQDAGDDEDPPKAKRGWRGKVKDPVDDEEPSKPQRSKDTGPAKEEAKSVRKTRDRTKAKDDKAKAGDDDVEIEIDGEESSKKPPRADPVPLPGEQPPPVPAGPRPLAINDRPLTVAKDQLEFHGGLTVLSFTLPTIVAGVNTTTTITSLPLGLTYGLDDKSEIGGDYAPSLSPGSATGPLTLHGAYHAVHSAKLDVALAAAVAIDFADAIDPATMMTSTKTSFALDLGAWARYRVTPKLSLFTGLPALPNAPVTLTRSYFVLPPLPYQLSIGVNNGGAIALELPAGVGFQAAPNIYAFATTNLANLKISKTVNAFLFADFIPISLGGFYSLPKLDLGAELGMDLKQGTDYLRFQLVARYYK